MALWCETALVNGAWADGVRIAHADGVILSVETGVAPSAGDERLVIGVPGMPNVHSHAFQRGMAGLAERRGEGAGVQQDDTFWTWREVMYRFLDRLTPDDVEAIASLAYAEMLESGFTRVGEFHYLHHAPDGVPYLAPGELAARIAAAACETGIGLTLLPVFYAQGGFGGAPPAAGQRRFLNTPESFARLMDDARAAIGGLPDARVGVAPHSLRAVGPEALDLVVPLAGGGPVHMHVAEQAREVAECQAWCGARPIDWLLDHAPVDEGWCLIHATHASNGELKRVAAAGAAVGLCPITESNLGDGIFPAALFLDVGGRIGLGTDSNVLLDVAAELRTLEYSQRLASQTRNVLASQGRASVGATLFLETLAGGSRALGVEAGLRPGGSLDLVSLDPDHPSLVGREGDAVLDAWIFGARDSVVQSVWRRGRKVVQDGGHVRRAAITSRYRRVLERLLGE